MQYQAGEDKNWATNRGVSYEQCQARPREGQHIHCWGKCYRASDLPKALREALAPTRS